MSSCNVVLINGFELISCDYETGAELIVKKIRESASPVIFTHLNLYNYYNLIIEKRKIDFLANHCFFFFEGIGMKIGAFILGRGWNIDINGTDLFPVLMEKCSRRKIKCFLLGTRDKNMKKAVSVIKAKYPEIEITGFNHGYFGSDEENEIVARINASGAELLISGMGIKKESDFIHNNYEDLHIKAVWNVGALFDFISGAVPRAPCWMRQLRLEWLYRFVRDPARKSFRIFALAPWWTWHCLKLKINPKNIRQKSKLKNAV